MAEVMFQNVAYRATVYRTGDNFKLGHHWAWKGGNREENWKSWSQSLVEVNISASLLLLMLDRFRSFMLTD